MQHADVTHDATTPSRSLRAEYDTAALSADIAWHALEAIDYGVIVADVDRRAIYCNRPASLQLEQGRFLHLRGGSLVTATVEQTAHLAQVLQAAAGGRRQMLHLYSGAEHLAVACVPLGPTQALGATGPALLMLGRNAGTRNLSMTFFARTHNLTPAEELVLRGLCDGLEVKAIAKAHGVCESTVRTQVRGLRDKTCVSSIRQLVQRVAALPPVLAAAVSGAQPFQAACAVPHNAAHERGETFNLQPA